MNRENRVIEVIVRSECAPSPIKPRVCACGCGHEFQPKRKDQRYLNKQHADYHYNHTKRNQIYKRVVAANRKKANLQIIWKLYSIYQIDGSATFSTDILELAGYQFPSKEGANNTYETVSFLGPFLVAHDMDVKGSKTFVMYV